MTRTDRGVLANARPVLVQQLRSSITGSREAGVRSGAAHASLSGEYYAKYYGKYSRDFALPRCSLILLGRRLVLIGQAVLNDVTHQVLVRRGQRLAATVPPG